MNENEYEVSDRDYYDTTVIVEESDDSEER